MGAGTGTGENPLAFLRDHEMFQQIRSVIQQNPNMLSTMLQQIGQSNPQLLQIIFFFFFFLASASSSSSTGASSTGGGSSALGSSLTATKQADDVLGLDHVVLINLELTEDVVNLSLGHLVSPGFQSVLEHLGVNLSLVVVNLESLDNQVIGVVALASHLLGEHLGHVFAGAGSTDLTQKSIQLTLSHQDTNVVEGATEVVFVQNSVLVDVHELEAVLVHLDLLVGESALILTLAHLCCVLFP